MKLRIRHPSGEARVVEIDPMVGTLQELKTKVSESFGFSAAVKFQLLLGQQPPIALTGEGTLQEMGLNQPQVLLIAELPASEVAKQQQQPKKKKPAAAAAKRPKSDYNKEDDDDDEDYDSGEEDDDKPKKKRAKKSSSSFIASGTIRRNNSTAKRSKVPRTVEGLGESLAAAHAPGGDDDPTSKHFRKLTKAHVKLQYEISAAEAKYSAALRNEYEIFQSTMASTYRLGDGQAVETKLLVKYRKGPRSYANEEVQGMSLDLLRATIDSLLQQPVSEDPDDAFKHPREKLRAHVLPMSSPRVFWSLVHHFGGGENCITRALISLLPQYDWSFLDTRVRVASQLGRAAKRTEQAFADIEEQEHREQETNDDGLCNAVPNWQTREKLRAKGVNSLQQLATDVPVEGEYREFVLAARTLVLEQCMQTLFPDSVQRSKIEAMQFRTPLDVKRWSVPGRSEFVQRELGMENLDQINEWKSTATKMVQDMAWLGEPKYRSNG